MTRYLFSPPKEKPFVYKRERWETFAAFLTFTAFVALAGATYGSLLRGDVYDEVHSNGELRHFSGLLDASHRLPKELADESKTFTIIAPTDVAFRTHNVIFASEKDGGIEDKRIIESAGGEHYMLSGEGYVVRSQVLPGDIPVGQSLQLPAANGDTIVLSRMENRDQTIMTVNGEPVRERILADNGVIYLVDGLIRPLPGAKGYANR